MILKLHVYSRIAFAIMIAFLTGSIVFMAFDTTPPYEYDESASFVVPSIERMRGTPETLLSKIAAYLA